MRLARRLGEKGPEVYPIGVGTWAIGGEFWEGEQPLGWGQSDDARSVRALRRAHELGATFFDTSDAYGTGHAERLIGRAFAGLRDQVVIGTKWGNVYDEDRRRLYGVDASPEYVRTALTASLERLGTDYLDLYQLHISDASIEDARALRDACDGLVREGLIRGYGWSTDDPDRAEVFASGAHCWAIQHEMNVLSDAPEMSKMCERYGVASINRSPLAMGLLSGRHAASAGFASGDIRSRGPEWLKYFRDGRPDPEWLDRLDAVRDVLTTGGRTLVQGALCWLLARSDHAIPIPGVRTWEQATGNVSAAELGPLDGASMAEIDRLLGRTDG